MRAFGAALAWSVAAIIGLIALTRSVDHPLTTQTLLDRRGNVIGTRHPLSGVGGDGGELSDGRGDGRRILRTGGLRPQLDATHHH